MNEVKELIKKYERIFDFLKKSKKFDNLKFELETQKIDYREIESQSKYYINDNDFIIVFGKINCLENKTMIYLTISKNYSTSYDKEYIFWK